MSASAAGSAVVAGALDADPLRVDRARPADQLGVPGLGVGDAALLDDHPRGVHQTGREQVFVGVDPYYSHDC